MSPFPSRMFRGAAIYGVLVLAPLLLMPLPPRQPEIPLGFVGVALMFQWVFWVIGGEPARYRALMLPAVGEKMVFGIPVLAFIAMGRTEPVMAVFAGMDVLLGLGFLVAWRQTAARAADRTGAA